MMRLNLGCGDKVLDGWVNYDYMPVDNRVKYIDLNDISQLQKIPSDSADEIRCYHVLEHIQSPYEVVMEFERILKPGGILDIRLPIFCNILPHLRHYHSRSYLHCLYKAHNGNRVYSDSSFNLVSFSPVVRKSFKSVVFVVYNRVYDWFMNLFYSDYRWVLKKKN